MDRANPTQSIPQGGGTRNAPGSASAPDMLAAALGYARQGIRVFPLYGMRDDGTCQCGHADCPDAGKHPRTSHGLRDGTTSETIIRAWWKQWPEANIGGRTGSRMVVFEPDAAEGFGEAMRYGVDLDGPHSTSRPGHRHHFYKPPEGAVLQNQTKKLGHWPFEFCDARGEGGYVVLPPSRHYTGSRYIWATALDVATLPDIPEALLAVWRTPPTDPRAGTLVWDEADGVWAEEMEEPNENAGEGFATARYFLARYLDEVYAGADRNPTGLLLALQLRDAPLTYDAAVPFMRRYQVALETACPEKRDYSWDEAERTLKQVYSTPRRAPVHFARGQAGTAHASTVTTSEATARPWPEPMADAAYYGVLGTIARETEAYIEADSAALLVNLLAATGVAIGPKPYLQRGVHIQRAVLNVANVGETSGGKSDSTAPLHLIFHEAAHPPEAHKAHGEAAVDFATLAAHVPTFSGLSTGEGLLWPIRDERRTQKQNKKTHQLEDIVEPGVTDKRLLVMEAEFARVFAVMRREGNNLDSVIRELYDCLPTARSSPKGDPIVVTNPHVGMIVQITPSELRRRMPDTFLTNGFTNRFSWTLTHRIHSLPNPPDYGTLVGEHAAKWRTAVQVASGVGRVQFDREAEARWAVEYDPLRDGTRLTPEENTGDVPEAIGRGHVFVMRVALIHAVLEGSAHITVKHLDAAIAAWDFCERCAAYLFGDGQARPVEQVIAEALRGRGALRREEIRGLFSRHQPSAVIQAALDALRQAGKVRTWNEPTGGRPIEWWEWVPQ